MEKIGIILEKNFQDSVNNVTRFLIMSKELEMPNVNEVNLMIYNI